MHPLTHIGNFVFIMQIFIVDELLAPEFYVIDVI